MRLRACAKTRLGRWSPSCVQHAPWSLHEKLHGSTLGQSPLTQRWAKRLNNPSAHHSHQGTAAPAWEPLRFEILQALAIPSPMLGRDKLARETRTCKRLKRVFQTLPYPHLWPTMRVQVPIGVNNSSVAIIDSEESWGQDCNRNTNHVTRAQRWTRRIVGVTMVISAQGT